MDDTLWIAQSKTKLEQIINIATSFYQMADIQVNPHKSLFITNNNSSHNISFLNCNIPRIPKNQPFKFLGCWFTLDNKISKQIQLIQEEIFQLVNIASTKKITDKQIIYIINTVIIPTLEYRIHNIVLSRTVAKHKANLSQSIPNSTMLNHHFYNIYKSGTFNFNTILLTFFKESMIPQF